MKTLFIRPNLRKVLFAGAACSVLGAWTSSLNAETYIWQAGGTAFGDAANWSPAGGPPTATDSIVYSSGNSNMIIGGDTEVVNFTSNPSATRTFQRGSGGGTYTLTVSGTLSKGGTGALVFRNPGSATNRLALDINAVELSQGTLGFGSGNSGDNYLEGVSIDSAALSGGVMQFIIGSTSGTANIDGNLNFTGNGTVRVRGLGSSVNPQSGVLDVGSLSSTGGNGIVEANAQASGNSVTGLLRLNNAAGTSTYSGVIQNGGTVGNVLSVEKNNVGTQVLTGASTYTGATTINAGTLLVGAGGTGSLGNTAVTVNAGTLGGTGSVAGTVAVGNGAGGSDSFLAAGDGTGALGAFAIAGSLSLNSDAAFVFEYSSATALADLVTANGVSLAGGLFSITDIAPGVLAQGTQFTVIDNTSGSAFSGVFSNLAEGAVFSDGANQFQATYLGGTGNDLVITVVPEPAVTGLLGAGLASVLFFRRRVS